MSNFIITCQCGSEYTHFEIVSVCAPWTQAETMVVSSGEDEKGCTVVLDLPAPIIKPWGRRQEFNLVGRCEECDGELMIRFVQNKGQTLVFEVGAKVNHDPEYGIEVPDAYQVAVGPSS